jgi:hypothetical protein
MEVFFLFALATSAGSLTTLYWIPEQDLGRGYFQMNALVVLGLLALAAAVAWLHPFHPFGPHVGLGAAALAAALAGGFLYYGAVWRRRWRLGRWFLSLCLAGSLGALLLSGASLAPPAGVPALPLRGLLTVACLLSSSLLLGWSLIAMLLGHWYLVAPRLTFRHLALFCWVLVAAVVVRALAVGAAMTAAALADPLAVVRPLRVLAGFGGQGMFFWFRLLWGLAMPLVLSVMALRCARQRSNQSATGILYVLVVGSFIGEVTAYYLLLTTGVPV